MKKVYLSCLLLLIGISNTIAQSGTITGTVTDDKGAPLQYVNVSLEGTAKGSTTNKSGVYQINNVAPGQYSLNFSMIGYVSQKVEVQVTPNQTKTVSPLVLVVDRKELSEIIVTDEKYRYVVNKVSPSLRQRIEIAKLPQNIQIVDNELLQDQQVTSMMEGVIRNVSGVTMMEHWGNFANLRMRGFRLPALRNGINVSDSWGPLSEDMALIERIEFVKGPSGFMLAAGEPGGFYNVVTKKPTDRTIASANLMVGSFDFYRGSVDFGGKLTDDGKLLYRLNGLYQTADSHRGDEDAQRLAIAPALTYNFSNRTSFTAELNYQQAESYLGSAYVFAPAEAGFGSVDRNFRMTDTNYPATDISETAIYLNFQHQFSENWYGTVQLSHLNYNQEGNSAWVNSVSDNGDAFRYISKWDALSLGYYAQAFVNGKVQTGPVSHTILGGFDYTDKEYWADFFESADDTVAFNIFNPTYGRIQAVRFDRSLEVQDRSEDPWDGFTTRAFYLQDQFGFMDDRIRLTLAGRYTHIDTEGKDEDDKVFTPRMGLSVDILPDLTVYGLYDQSFLPQAGTTFDGETFDEENAYNIEGGIKKSFFDGKVRATLGAFFITKENVLVADPENAFFSLQLGEVQSNGIEFDVQGEIIDGLNVVLNYAHTNVEITKDDANPENVGDRVAGHARHMTNGWFTYHFAENSSLSGFGVSLGYQYQIDRSTWDWGADNEALLPDYFRLDGGVFWGNEKLRVQLNVNNILDEYLYSGAPFGNYIYWQSEPGINGRVALTYNIK